MQLVAPQGGHWLYTTAGTQDTQHATLSTAWNAMQNQLIFATSTLRLHFANAGHPTGAPSLVQGTAFPSKLHALDHSFRVQNTI